MFYNPFPPAAADLTVQSLLGINPTRLYPFARAPQKPLNGSLPPYAVWQHISGNPELYVNEVSDIDHLRLQFDCYSPSLDNVRDIAVALRNVYDKHGYVVDYRAERIDEPTGMYTIGFDAEFWRRH